MFQKFRKYARPYTPKRLENLSRNGLIKDEADQLLTDGHILIYQPAQKYLDRASTNENLPEEVKALVNAFIISELELTEPVTLSEMELYNRTVKTISFRIDDNKHILIDARYLRLLWLAEDDYFKIQPSARTLFVYQSDGTLRGLVMPLHTPYYKEPVIKEVT